MDAIHLLFEEAREIRAQSRHLIEANRETRAAAREACARASATRAQLDQYLDGRKISGIPECAPKPGP